MDNQDGAWAADRDWNNGVLLGANDVRWHQSSQATMPTHPSEIDERSGLPSTGRCRNGGDGGSLRTTYSTVLEEAARSIFQPHMALRSQRR